MIRRRIILALCIVVFAHITSAQEQYSEGDGMKTMFGSGNPKISGFGGPSINFSSVDGDFAIFFGGKGGVIINNKVIFGLEGNQLITDISHKAERDRDLNFNYGGIFAGYIIDWQSRVHLTPSLMVGWGGIGKRRDYDYDSFEDYDNNWDEYWSEYFRISDHVLVIQPSLELELNVFKILRVGLGVNYRIASGIGSGVYSNDDLSSIGGVFSIKFGDF
ncbi:hypothetical protein [Aquimarina sediminis]|uniref:hypothetical protein n=1 Tax=Aquimarina sediminis TaxID=2070536 RepID=UPI000CA07308|nr:hypothetical protein [Aquimarina sediminis]